MTLPADELASTAALANSVSSRRWFQVVDTKRHILGVAERGLLRHCLRFPEVPSVARDVVVAAERAQAPASLLADAFGVSSASLFLGTASATAKLEEARPGSHVVGVAPIVVAVVPTSAGQHTLAPIRRSNSGPPRGQ
jgi:hypothetical protein